jgi:hypothetical protein
VTPYGATRLEGGLLRLYTQKTGTHVHLPLPEFVLRALDACPKMSERYWFWTGTGKLSTAVGRWQGRLLDLAEDARIQRLHAHRFRDTFAVSLLLEGLPIGRVSILLGHSSSKVTAQHYSPWIRERQEQAEADVRRTWARDPVALMGSKANLAETNDTPLKQGKREVANQMKTENKTWRRGWESNPRARFCQATRFRGGLFRPLRHLSAVAEPF